MGANALYMVDIAGNTLKISQAGAESLIAAGNRVSLDFNGALHLLGGFERAEAA
jgi:putative spermidine/putrescine transport system ATP-binding protein